MKQRIRGFFRGEHGILRSLRARLAVLFTIFTGAVLAIALGISFSMTASQIRTDNEQWFSSAIDSVASQMQDISSLSADEQPTIADQAPYIISIRLNDEAVSVTDGWVEDSERNKLFNTVKAEAEAQGQTSGWVMSSYPVRITEAGEAVDTGEVFEAREAVGAVGAVTAGTAAAAEATNDPADTPSEDVEVSLVADTAIASDGYFETAVEGTAYRAAYFLWPILNADGTDGATYEVAILEDLSALNNRILMQGLGYIAIFLLGLVVLFFANWLLAKLVLRPTAEGIRRQNEFVAAASHELRSPLAVIRSSLSAADASTDEAQAQKYRDTAADETARMGRLIDDMLLLASDDSANPLPHCQPVDLDTLLIETGETYTPLAKERDVDLRLDLPEATLPTLYTDPDHLRQILAVLLDNALCYTPGESEILLCARAKKHRVILQVIDHGPGIPPEEKDKVFQRFYRADKSRQDKRHFGLGLSIAKELAERGGGSLAVADTPGGGATFTLELPLGTAGDLPQ